MSDRAGKLVWGLVAVAIVVAGLWIYARINLADRVSRLENAIGDLGYARGGALPTEEDVRRQVADSAAAAGVEVDDVRVTVRREHGLDPAGRVLQEGAARVQGGGPVPRLSMELVRYDVHAHVTADQWLWSVDETVERTVTLRGRTSLDVR